ncbi:F-box family protein, partial [Trifolium medium]|nr:F-box family protein [Trifolium medium]
MIVIVVFDLMERKLFEMPLPDDFHHSRENYGGDFIGKDGDRLVKYNDKGQLLEYLHIDRDADELAMYTESLFSLPGE